MQWPFKVFLFIALSAVQIRFECLLWPASISGLHCLWAPSFSSLYMSSITGPGVCVAIDHPQHLLSFKNVIKHGCEMRIDSCFIYKAGLEPVRQIRIDRVPVSIILSRIVLSLSLSWEISISYSTTINATFFVVFNILEPSGWPKMWGVPQLKNVKIYTTDSKIWCKHHFSLNKKS